MKKVIAFILSAVLLVSFAGCEFLFRQDPIPEETDKLPETTPPIDVVPPSVEPTAEPEATPTVSPEIEEPEPTQSAEPVIPPEDAEELKIYVNGAPLTVPVISYSGELRQNVLNFSMLYDNAAYGVEFKNNAYLFTPLAEDANPVNYIEISYINGGKAETILPAFADSYIDFTDIEFSSYNSVGVDALSAESVIAYNASQYLTAYLIDVDGGVITIVISSTSQYTETYAWFNAMVATFSIE